MKRAVLSLAVVMTAGLAVATAAAQQQPPQPTPDQGGASDIGREVLDALQREKPPGGGEVEIAPSVAGELVVMRGLDKLTGEVATFEAKVGEEAEYGRLRIEAKACYARTASRAPESTAFLQIYDTKEEPDSLTFSGWMFASSPALSAMDHARYDVWVLSCKTS